MTLKKPKAKGSKGQGKKQPKKKATADKWAKEDVNSDEEVEPVGAEQGSSVPGSMLATSNELAVDDPLLTVPLPRYNAMLAVLKNTLFMYVKALSFILISVLKGPYRLRFFPQIWRDIRERVA